MTQHHVRQEKSKTFRKLARIGNFYPSILKKSHRGLVAKLSLPRLEKYELDQFAKSLPMIKFREPIIVKQYGQEIDRIFI